MDEQARLPAEIRASADPAIQDYLAFQDRQIAVLQPPPHPEVPDEVRAGILRAYDERIDVFCYVFGFPQPDYLRTMHRDEMKRRELAVVRPPTNFRRWYSATVRAIVRETRRPVFRP
jgi:hypothetical protein